MNKTTVLLLTVGAILGAASAPLAHADTTADDSYVMTLDYFNVPYPSRDDAISYGKAVCEEIREGYSEMSMIPTVSDVDAMTRRQASYLVGAAVAAYCPALQDI